MRVQRRCVLGLVGAGWLAFACAADEGDSAVQSTTDESPLGSAEQVLSVAKPGGQRTTAFDDHRQRAHGRHGHHGHRRHRGHHCPPPPVDACKGPLRFDLVASSSDVVVGTAPVALNNAGLVAFAGNDGGVEQLLVGGNGAPAAFDLAPWGLERLIRVALDDAGDIAFLAATPTSGTEFGAFATNLGGSTPSVLYAPEVGGGLGDEGSLESSSRLAMAANGIVAFSSIQDGRGALYRGPVTGSITVLHTGDGEFFNNQEMDVNAGGTVILQMEHGACGLQRGILVFDTPELPIDDTFKAIAGLNVGQQPDGALNDSGLVAVALAGTNPDVEVLRCPEGEPFERFNVALGVYTAIPTPLSDPPNLSLVTDTTGAFVSFGAVDINNAGTVVFEATLDAGGRGIFRGADAVANKIVAAGDTLGGEVITDVQLGQLNDNCQLSMATVSASGRSVWRVSGIAR